MAVTDSHKRVLKATATVETANVLGIFITSCRSFSLIPNMNRIYIVKKKTEMLYLQFQ